MNDAQLAYVASWSGPTDERYFDGLHALGDVSADAPVRNPTPAPRSAAPEPVQYGPPERNRSPETRLVYLSDVVAERVEWAWHGRLALGKLNLLDGDPGLGKSTITADLAARITAGDPMPDGSPGIGPASVVICSAEDGLADTIRPRLEAAGADLARVVSLSITDEAGERSIAIPDDLTALESAIAETGAKLVIIDPLMAHLPSAVNSYRDQDMRRALAPLKALAERLGVAVLVVRHLTKAPGGSPMYRGGGSIGIIAAARVGLLVAADPDDESGARRVLAPIKSSLAAPPEAMTYCIEPVTIQGEDGPIETSRIVWGSTSDHTAARLLAVRAEDSDEAGALDEAKAVLAEILDAGPMPAKDASNEARQAGISEATLRRAKAALGVSANRVGGLASKGRWYWSLPAKAFNETLSRSLAQGEHLREFVSTLAGERDPTLTYEPVDEPIPWASLPDEEPDINALQEALE